MNELLKHDRLLQPKNRTADQIEIIGFQNFRTYLNVIMKQHTEGITNLEARSCV